MITIIVVKPRMLRILLEAPPLSSKEGAPGR